MNATLRFHGGKSDGHVAAVHAKAAPPRFIASKKTGELYAARRIRQDIKIPGTQVVATTVVDYDHVPDAEVRKL